MTALPVTRPPLRYFGGKWLLAPWIIAHFPPHRVYVEPFGGGASVLLRKAPAYAEYYGDLDEGVVEFFEVLRDQPGELERLLRFTPFARVEFERAYAPADTPLERARRLVIRSIMGFGGDGATSTYRTGFRATSNRSGTTPAHDWKNYPDAIHAMAERLQGVVLESKPAPELMAAHDGPETLHYVNPPYLPETRARLARTRSVDAEGKDTYRGSYRFEMTPEQHGALLECLLGLQGGVVLSGYPSALYDGVLCSQGWRRVQRQARADGARARTEVLWINPRCREMAAFGPLFGDPAAPAAQPPQGEQPPPGSSPGQAPRGEPCEPASEDPTERTRGRTSDHG